MTTNISTLIIDDEVSNRDLIKNFILKLSPHYKIIGEAENADTAFTKINQLKPDLIFLDIKMPGSNGFDLLKKFETPEFEVVFVTGFDEYAIQAFECNALDYILKPIETNKFKLALEKIKMRLDNKLSNPQNLKNILQSYNAEKAIITKIPLHYKNHVFLLDMTDLMYVKSEQGCTIFYTLQQDEFVSSKKLIDFEFIINRFPNFIRINRGTYINLNFIKSYSKGAECSIFLKDGSSFEISRRRKTDILSLLEKK